MNECAGEADCGWHVGGPCTFCRATDRQAKERRMNDFLWEYAQRCEMDGHTAKAERVRQQSTPSIRLY